MTYRLYCSPESWVVDEGDPSTAQMFRKVVCESVGVTHFDPTQDGEFFPRLWIEYPTENLIVVNDTAILR